MGAVSCPVSGTSALVVQGTAGTSEEHLKYGWNYALLLADGPSAKALVPSPIVELNRAVAVGMASGPAAGLAIADTLVAALAGYHLLPSVPYHALNAAHRRLIATLTPDSPYHRSNYKGLPGLVARLVRSTMRRQR